MGYAQGMNDLLARFLVVTFSEVDSYWLFKHYMDSKREDFLEETMMIKVGKSVWSRKQQLVCVCVCACACGRKIPEKAVPLKVHIWFIQKLC